MKDEYEATYHKKGKSREKCQLCKRFIQDGQRVKVRKVVRSKHNECGDITTTTSIYFHEECVK